MRWLITGGCGFIGARLVEQLAGDGGHAVRVVDNLVAGARAALARAGPVREAAADAVAPMTEASGIELVVGDVGDAALARAAAAGAEVIVHLAASRGAERSLDDPRTDCLVNVVGTLNYLEAAREAKVARFVFASSGTPPIDEELPPQPVSPHGASKLAGEGYCAAYWHAFGVPAVSLRFGNVYGPGSEHKTSVIAQFIRRARAGQALEIHGDGRQTRDFIYVDDLLRAVRAAAVADAAAGEIFHIATGAETPVGRIVTLLIPHLARAGLPHIAVRRTVARAGDPRRGRAVTAKARRLLGWQAEIELDEGLRRTVAWFLGGAAAAAE